MKRTVRMSLEPRFGLGAGTNPASNGTERPAQKARNICSQPMGLLRAC
jgi:hypothetical protein